MEQLTRKDYTIGWLCALAESELLAAMEMLDEKHKPIRLPSSDTNNYKYGSINRHNVVITCLPYGMPGKVNASIVVGHMSTSFPNIMVYLLVGIGGGVPHKLNNKNPYDDIHLGDVVVNWPKNKGDPPVIQYDLARDLGDNNYQDLSRLNKPDRRIVNALTTVISDRKGGTDTFHDRLHRIPTCFQHPNVEDILFETDATHQKHPFETDSSDLCSACDKSRLIKRKGRANPVPPLTFHLGTILSGDTAMRNAEQRDRYRDRYPNSDVICIEMEAAGVQDETQCLVIRGIADYADSHHNHVWQNFAAMQAAAFACELLHRIEPSEVDEIRSEAHDMTSRNPIQTASPYTAPSSVSASQSYQQSLAPQRLIGPDLVQDTLLLEAEGESHAETEEQYEKPGGRSNSTYPDFERAMGKGVDFLKQRERRTMAQNLSSARTCFLEARRKTDGMPSPDSKILIFRASHKLMYVELKMSYDDCKSLCEREAHLQRAQEYGKDASNVACGPSKSSDLSLIKLEQGVVKARRVKLKAKAGVDSIQLGKMKSEALQMIDEALSESQNSPKYERRTEYAKTARESLSIF